MTYTRLYKWLRITLFSALIFLVLSPLQVYALDGGMKVELTAKEKAWLSEHPVIRIGESSEFEPELIRNPDGTYGGTLPEFTSLLEERLGIKIEIVDDKWPHIFRRIKEKDIDAIGLMSKDVAKKMGLITIDAPYNVLVTAFARKDRPFKIEDDKDIEGLRVAFFKDIVFLKKYFEGLKGKVEAIEAGSPLDAMKLLLDKKADVMVGFNEDSYLMVKNSIREIEPIYTFKELDANAGTAVRPDAPLLASILAKSFNSISRHERDKIMTKWTWMPAMKERNLALSDEEKAWLEAHPVLKLGYDIDWLPIEQIDENGNYVGLAADFLSLIEQRLGITIKPATPVDWASMLDLAKKGELDLLSAVAQTQQRDEFLDFTQPYLSFPMVIVTHEEVTYIKDMNDLTGKRVGVVSGYATQDHLANEHPGIEVVPASDMREGLLDVVHGNTFAFIDNLATISRVMAREGFSHIKISGETPYRFDLSIGIRKGEPILGSIMQKALDSISEEEQSDIYNRWISVVFEHKFNYRLLWQVLAAAIVVLAAILYWNRRLTVEVKQRQQVEAQLRMANEAAEKIMGDLYYEIEERKIVESKLRRLTVAVDQNPASIVITDLDGNIEYINPQFARSTGYTSKEAVGLKPSILKSGYQPDAYYRELWETITAGQIWRGEFLNKKKNGELYWESASIAPIIDGEGKIVNYVGLKLDITTQKAADEALKKSEASLARAQKIAHIGNWEWNIKENELHWSDEIYRIFGIKPGQFTATYEAFVDFVHHEDRKILEDTVQKALGGKARYSIDHRIVLADGVEKVVHEDGEVEFDDNNRPVRMMGTVHDITERKKIEEALQKAKEEAEKATKLKDKFVSLVSHDLKNPIQRILGYIELLREMGQVNNTGKEMIDHVLKACDDMSSLIDEVLKLSRIKGGKIIPDYSIVSIHETVKETIDNYSTLASEKGIELINDIPETAEVYADERLILEVIQNLVSNSVKFCKRGDKIRLFVPEGEPATIAVADTGAGIEKESQKSLFRYEEKTSTRGTANETGTGFGLPLCNDIVTAHGGTLDLESEVGKGSTFYVRLPEIKEKKLS